MNNGQAVIQ